MECLPGSGQQPLSGRHTRRRIIGYRIEIGQMGLESISTLIIPKSLGLYQGLDNIIWIIDISFRRRQLLKS